MNEMIVLPRDQIDRMIEVMDRILNDPKVTVEKIKEVYDLTSEEYDMLMDLTMPLIRRKNEGGYWKIRYMTLKNSINELLAETTMPKKNPQFEAFVSKLIEVMDKGNVGELNSHYEGEEYEDYYEGSKRTIIADICGNPYYGKEKT